MDTLGNKKRKIILSTLEQIRVLIIDEISMVNLTLISQMNFALQEAKGNKKWFGGIIVIYIGDFNQIPPVSGKTIVYRPDILQLMNIVELKQGMRQATDPKFQNALDNFAEGQCGKHNIELFDSRIDSTNADWTNGPEVTAIHWFNEAIDSFNNKILEKFFLDNITTYKAKYE